MTDELIKQFGKTLLRSDDGDGNETITPTEALTEKDHILLYFSAKWCGPCRNFTPLLIDFYNKFKSTKNFEIVFCSLDNDEAEYKAYTSKMPWLSMPFDAKETKTMANTYDAKGIPHLVVVDGTTGDIITKDGTEEVREDKGCVNFPWKPKSFGELWPTKILSSKDCNIASDSFKDKYLMLYFSAHWCPPCRAFTPKLSEAYTTLKTKRQDFELVFVSSDRDESSFNAYFDTMSFCALPFEHRDEKAGLSKLTGVQGIPTLVMLGPVADSGDRPIINTNIRRFIDNEEFSEFPFYPKNYGDVSDIAADFNDVKSLIILYENGDDEEQAQIKKIVAEAAKKMKEDGEESTNPINFGWALETKGLSPRIRSLTGLPEMSEDATMILLDLPDDGGYYKSDITDITVENIMSFIETPGKRKQLE